MKSCFSIRWIPMFLLLTAGSLFLQDAQGQGRKLNFEKQIYPILKKSCVECHQAPYEENGKLKKPKAGLRLDAAWAISMGSEDGKVLEPGNAEESSLYTLVMLPADDDDVMPPDGKADPLTEEQKALLKTWIDQGADFGGWAGNLEGKPKDLSNTGGKIPVSEIQEVYKKLGEGLKPVKEDQWKGVQESGGQVAPIAEESPLLSVDFRHADKEINDGSLAGLESLGKHVVQLDLSKTGVTDAAMDSITGLERLVRLNLSQTQISDAGLKKISGLKNLRYLNLYGTQVGDAGLESLGKLPALESVYLWNSKVTGNGVKKLQKKFPEAKISWK